MIIQSQKNDIVYTKFAINSKKLSKKYEYAWDKYTKKDLEKVFELSEKYIDFMSKCKTERECVT